MASHLLITTFVYPVIVAAAMAVLKIDSMSAISGLVSSLTSPTMIRNLDFSNGRTLFLLGLVCFHLVEQYLRLRKHLAFSNGLDPLLKGRISEQTYQETTEHNMIKNYFGVIKAFFSLTSIIFSIFIFWPVTWSIARTHFSEYSYAETLVVPAVFSFMNEVIDLFLMGPLNAYATFVVDKKHNNYTILGYVYDKLKSLVGLSFLNSFFLWGLVCIVEWAGPDAWKYTTVFGLCVVIAVQILFPVTIAKCFNTFTPLEEGELKTAIDELVSKTNLDCNQCYMVDGSTQSKHSNAYVAGMCGTRRIVIYDTLVTDLKNDKSRVSAVIGHEIGHAKLNHTWVLTFVQSLNLFAMFYVFSFFQNDAELAASFGFHGKATTFLRLHCFMAVYSSCLMPFFSVLINSIVRQLEFQADAYSVKLGYDIRLALLDISKENLGELNPDPWHAAYHYTHPPLLSRLQYVTDLKGGAPMPKDVVTQYIKVPEKKEKEEVENAGKKADAENDDDDDNADTDETDENDVDLPPPGSPPKVVMAPPADPPPPTGVVAINKGTIELAAEPKKKKEKKKKRIMGALEGEEETPLTCASEEVRHF